MADIELFLKDRESSNLLRRLSPAGLRKDGSIFFDEKEYADFSSNDYLGLSNHPAIVKALSDAANTYGVGSSASRLLSGDLKICHELEGKIAELKYKEAGLVFNSGYQANIGIISALSKSGDAIFTDRLNHASIVDGILLAGVKFFRFRHNDAGHLDSLLKKERSKFKDVLIVTESLFSMDGDLAPLEELVFLKDKYNARLLVDEAHATGIFGRTGSGLCEETGLSADIDIIMGTFGKALGSFGAYAACSRRMKEYLVNSSRSFIYSTALPPPIIAANLKAIELIEEEPSRRKTLLANSEFFRESLIAKGFEIKGSSQIVPLVTKDVNKTLKAAEKLKAKGYYCMPIRPPTVPEGEARIRFSLTYNHSKKVLKELVDDISICCKI